MAKKKKVKRNKAQKKSPLQIFTILFLVFYVISAFYLLSQLYDKPFMSYCKDLRYVWVFLFWIFIGILGYNILQPRQLIKQRYIIIIFLALTFAGFLFRMNGTLFLGGDSGLYMILAESLAEFKGYVNVHMPNPAPHTLYGFGLPLLIAPALFVFGLNMVAANFMIVLTSVGFAFFTFMVFKKYIKFEFALLIAIITGYNWWIMYFSSMIMTEIPFCFFMMMGFYFLDTYGKEDIPALGKYLFISAGIVFYSYQIKPIGIGLLAAAVVYFILIKRDWKKLLLFVGVCGIGFVLWNMRNYLATGSVGYLEFFTQAISREGVIGASEPTKGFGIIGNLFYKPFDVAIQGHKIFIPTMFQNMPTALNQLSIIFVIILYTGFIYSLFKHRSALDFAVAILFYGIVMYAYLIEPDRYYLPLIPFMYFYFIIGLKFLLSKIISLLKFKAETSLLNFSLLFVLIIMFFMNLISANKVIASEHSGKEYARDSYQEYYEMAMWIKEKLPKDAILASRLDKEMYVLTKRKGVNSRIYFSYDTEWTEEKGEEMVDYLKELIIQNDVDYYILDNARPDSYMTKMTLIKNPDVFNAMFTAVYASKSQGSYVLKVKPEWKNSRQ